MPGWRCDMYPLKLEDAIPTASWRSMWIVNPIGPMGEVQWETLEGETGQPKSPKRGCLCELGSFSGAVQSPNARRNQGTSLLPNTRQYGCRTTDSGVQLGPETFSPPHGTTITVPNHVFGTNGVHDFQCFFWWIFHQRHHVPGPHRQSPKIHSK